MCACVRARARVYIYIYIYICCTNEHVQKCFACFRNCCSYAYDSNYVHPVVKHQIDVHGLAKATCLHRIGHVIYARCYFVPEYIREFRLDTVHLPCSRYKYRYKQQTAQQVPLVHICRRHRQNVSPISYSHLHVYFVYIIAL